MKSHKISEVYNEWLDHFLRHSQPTHGTQTVLLILDGHSSHTKNLKLIWKATVRNVIIVSLPSHCTDNLQPLDVALLKTKMLRCKCGSEITLVNQPQGEMWQRSLGLHMAELRQWIMQSVDSKRVRYILLIHMSIRTKMSWRQTSQSLHINTATFILWSMVGIHNYLAPNLGMLILILWCAHISKSQCNMSHFVINLLWKARDYFKP